MILKNVLNKCLDAAGFLILFYTFFFWIRSRLDIFKRKLLSPFYN